MLFNPAAVVVRIFVARNFFGFVVRILQIFRHFLDADFSPALLRIPAIIRSEEYYVKMMVAWFFATALAKQWEATVALLEEQCLSPWVQNKAIQKARESYRISPEQKAYLLGLKR